MAGTLRLGIEIKGINRLRRNLDGDALLAQPLRQALEVGAAAGQSAAAGRAPRGATGKLGAKLTHRVDKRPVPRYAVVKTTATRTSAKYRRYSYPRRLEFDPKSRHKDWFLRAVLSVRPQVEQALRAAAGQIEQRWGRG